MSVVAFRFGYVRKSQRYGRKTTLDDLFGYVGVPVRGCCQCHVGTDVNGTGRWAKRGGNH